MNLKPQIQTLTAIISILAGIILMFIFHYTLGIATLTAGIIALPVIKAPNWIIVLSSISSISSNILLF